MSMPGIWKTTFILCVTFSSAYTIAQPVKQPKDTILPCEVSFKYPAKAQENQISGIVTLLYDIDSLCRLVNIRVEKGLGYGCDEEAIRGLMEAYKKCSLRRRNCESMKNIRQRFNFVFTTDD